MSYGIICRQKPCCDQWAAYRFTWPGQDESFICESHANKLRVIAIAMSMHLQLVELTPHDHATLGMMSLEDQRAGKMKPIGRDAAERLMKKLGL